MAKQQKQLQTSHTPVTQRPRQAKQARTRNGGEPITRSMARSTFLSLPESLLENILCLSGSDAPSLALSCKPLSGLWERHTDCQARWLLHNSSSIRVTKSNSAKLAQLLVIAKKIPEAKAREILWLSWALADNAGTARYGGCEGVHSDGSSCCFELEQEAVARQQELVKAARSGNVSHARSLICGPHVVNVQANGNEALRAAASAGRLGMVDFLLDNGANMDVGLVEGGGAFLEACKAGNLRVVKQLSQRRKQPQLQSKLKVLDSQDTAERIAILTSNLPLFSLLYYSNTAHYANYANQLQQRNSSSPDLSTLKFIIAHQRHPMPFIQVCMCSCFNPEWVVHCLLEAGKWATADSSVRTNFAQGDSSLECWAALCEGYLRKTELGDSWQATGGPGPTWEAVIECAQRSFGSAASLVQWRRIYGFSFSVGACKLALDTAEDAARRFSGYPEMLAIAAEHHRAGRARDALRCNQRASAIIGIANMNVGLLIPDEEEDDFEDEDMFG